MDRAANIECDSGLGERLARGGFRFTPQRVPVYAGLLRKRDHPTAEQVFIRAKREMPDISMATVYNCLDALVKCGMAREVTLERGAARVCPNMRERCREVTGRNDMISRFMGDVRRAAVPSERWSERAN